jgi:hypothetical protein
MRGYLKIYEGLIMSKYKQNFERDTEVTEFKNRKRFFLCDLRILNL